MRRHPAEEDDAQFEELFVISSGQVQGQMLQSKPDQLITVFREGSLRSSSSIAIDGFDSSIQPPRS